MIDFHVKPRGIPEVDQSGLYRAGW